LAIVLLSLPGLLLLLFDYGDDDDDDDGGDVGGDDVCVDGLYLSSNLPRAAEHYAGCATQGRAEIARRSRPSIHARLYDDLRDAFCACISTPSVRHRPEVTQLRNPTLELLQRPPANWHSTPLLGICGDSASSVYPCYRPCQQVHRPLAASK
jgi:hypothetical protein